MNMCHKASAADMTITAGDKGKEILSAMQSYGVDLTWFESKGLREQKERVPENLPGTEAVERMWTTCLNKAIYCPENVSLENATLHAGNTKKNIKKKCYKLTITVTAKDAAEIYDAVLEEAEADGDAAFLKMLRQLKEDYSIAFAADDSDEVLVMKLYVDKKGEVQGRTVAFGQEEAEFGLIKPERDGEFGYELYAKDGLGERIAITGNGKEGCF